MCPHCNSLDWSASELSGVGTVYSWMKPVHPPLPMFEPGTLVALIDLEEGIRLLSNLIEVDEAQVENGMSVEVRYVDTASDGRVPVFGPTARAGD